MKNRIWVVVPIVTALLVANLLVASQSNEVYVPSGRVFANDGAPQGCDYRSYASFGIDYDSCNTACPQPIGDYSPCRDFTDYAGYPYSTLAHCEDMNGGDWEPGDTCVQYVEAWEGHRCIGCREVKRY